MQDPLGSPDHYPPVSAISLQSHVVNDVSRCRWAEGDPLLRRYHDEEWGMPLRDSRALWESLVLDGFQAGLSWRTILQKRDAFRAAFRGFDPAVVARFDEDDVERLMADPGIVRARAKIRGAVRNAQAYLDMQQAGEDFAAFVWSFVDDTPIQGDGNPGVSATPESIELARALKRRGFTFVGPVIVYAWMQAAGLVNDHERTCFRRAGARDDGAIATAESPS